MANDPTLAQARACDRRFVYDQTMEECMPRKQRNNRPIRSACVAVARKLAVIMHAMWRDGSEFRFKEPKAQTGGSTTAAPKLVSVAA